LQWKNIFLSLKTFPKLLQLTSSKVSM
jgi:hypothetical protein